MIGGDVGLGQNKSNALVTRIAVEARADLLDHASRWATEADALDQLVRKDVALIADALGVLYSCSRAVRNNYKLTCSVERVMRALDARIKEATDG